MNFSKSIMLFGLCILVVGCVRLTDESGKVLQLGKDAQGFYVGASSDLTGMQQQSLFANVKGSIYETGEMMSVFGTCLSDDQQPLSNTSAYLSAWYPNGTSFVINQTMQEIQPGYFLYRAPMVSVQGTYLTEMDCFATPPLFAAAWGEWQNPYWVSRLAGLNDTLSNLSMQLGDLSVDMNNSFAITWDLLNGINTTINSSVYYLNQSIYYAAAVANVSVDRNDSYIVALLLNLTTGGGSTPPAGSLNYTESADDPVYMRTWYITVTAIDAHGKKVQYPDSQCYINTTLTPVQTAMTPQGVNFKFSEVIATRGIYSWTVVCQYL